MTAIAPATGDVIDRAGPNAPAPLPNAPALAHLNGAGVPNAPAQAHLTKRGREQAEADAAERHDLLAPFDPGVDWAHGGQRVAEESIRANASIAAEALINTGRVLIYAKGQLDHGGWVAWLESQGIAPRSAQKAMLLAVRFANAPALAHISRTKAYALMGMSDEQLGELSEKGVVDTLRLDQVEMLSVRELQAKVRALTSKTEKGADQVKALRDKVADCHETIDQLKAELEDRASKAEVEAAAPFNSAFARAMKALTQFEAALDTAPDPEASTRAWSALNTHLGGMAQRRADAIQPGLLVAKGAGR